jgi:hypothetical protein
MGVYHLRREFGRPIANRPQVNNVINLPHKVLMMRIVVLF